MAVWEPNKRNLKDKGDYGVRVARPGFDANNCANSQLLFNSGWPILQITELLDLTEDKMTTHYIYTETTTVTDKVTFEVISTETTTTEVPSVPAGYQSSWENNNYKESVRRLMVNKKYVVKISNTAPIMQYSYPVERTETDTTRTMKTRNCVEIKYGKKSHRMSYMPMFLASEWVSNTPGYVLIFSVDLRTDVDYPYDDAPLPFLSGTKDYGLKSASKFGSKVPGLCSNMFSKLVQCVKTEKTIRGDRPDFRPGVIDNRVIWCPIPNADLENDDIPAEAFFPYETFSYTEETSLGIKDDGGAYMMMNYQAFLTRYNASIGKNVPVAISTESFQSGHNQMNTLVVLRSPMVSPEYEELVI